ncbi:hypothetical protein IAR50_004989 [Cryptococcus sp. DSM 104548]
MAQPAAAAWGGGDPVSCGDSQAGWRTIGYVMKSLLGRLGFGEMGLSLAALPPSTKPIAALGGYGQAIIRTVIRLSFGSMAVVSGALVFIPLAVDLLEYYEQVDNVKDLAMLVFHQAGNGGRWVKVPIVDTLRKRHLETGKVLQGRFVVPELWEGATTDARRINDTANTLESNGQAALVRLGKELQDKFREEVKKTEQVEWADNTTDSESSSTEAETPHFAALPSTLPSEITPGELFLPPTDTIPLDSQAAPLLTTDGVSPSAEAIHLSLVGAFVVLFFACGLFAYVKKVRRANEEKRLVRTRKIEPYGSIEA